MIPRETIDTIFNTARIDEVVGDFVNLKKRGVNYLGLCPFHNEKTPSFTVSPAKGIYKCFGCGRGGNVVNFVMEHEQTDYVGAMKYLAKKYNIEIVEKERAPEEIELENERESLMIVCSFAQKFFSDNLDTEQGKAIGLGYLEERGFTPETIQKFQLGYAPESYKAFMNAALHAGYKLKYLIQAGLVSSRVKEGEEAPKEPSPEQCYDRFAGRVIFPIRNVSGRVIAFGGRTLKKDKNVAKYVNSPETPLYHKSNVLYGIDLARRAITAEDNCFLVEGYADVISMHQAGLENTVASSGTSLTVEQVRLIRRYTPNLTILYDGDEAGLKASERGLVIALKEGMNVKLVTLPPEDDPDTFARKHTSEELKIYLKANAVDFIVFRTRTLAKLSEGDPVKRAELIRDIIQAIAHIPEMITRSLYIRECSRQLHVEEPVLWNELRKIRRKLFDEAPSNTIANNPIIATPQEQHENSTAFSIEPQERELIRVLVKYGEEETTFIGEPEPGLEEPPIFSMKIADYIIQNLKADDVTFENILCQRIYNECCSMFERGEKINEDYFLRHGDEEMSSFSMSLSNDNYIESDWNRRSIGVKSEKDHLGITAEKAVFALKSRRVEIMTKKLTEQIRQPLNDDDLIKMLEQQKRLDTARGMLKKKLGRVI
jgi:DNA primase